MQVPRGFKTSQINVLVNSNNLGPPLVKFCSKGS